MFRLEAVRAIGDGYECTFYVSVLYKSRWELNMTQETNAIKSILFKWILALMVSFVIHMSATVDAFYTSPIKNSWVTSGKKEKEKPKVIWAWWYSQHSLVSFSRSRSKMLKKTEWRISRFKVIRFHGISVSTVRRNIFEMACFVLRAVAEETYSYECNLFKCALRIAHQHARRKKNTQGCFEVKGQARILTNQGQSFWRMECVGEVVVTHPAPDSVA